MYCAQVLSQNSGKRPINLFVSRQAASFSDATFSQYWATIMSKVDTMGQQHFAPSKARTMYVEHITSETGLPPTMWDGVAAIMDNTTRQWADGPYNPSRKRRLAQNAVNGHTRHINGRG